MARFAVPLNPSLIDHEGHSKFLTRLFSSGVALAHNANGWKVTQRGAGANMSVDIAAGDGLLVLPSGAYGFWGWTTATENIAVTPANPTNPRIDVVIAKINTSTTTTVTANSPNALEFQVMAGTPSGAPVAMSDSAIQSSIGSGVAWVKLGTVTVDAAVGSIVTAKITDVRPAISSLVYAAIADGSITASKYANGSISTAKFDLSAIGASCASTRYDAYRSTDFTSTTSSTQVVPFTDGAVGSLSITTTGKDLVVNASIVARMNAGGGSCIPGVRLNSVEYLGPVITGTPTITGPINHKIKGSVLPAGTYTFEFIFKGTTGYTAVIPSFNSATLLAYELPMKS